MAQEIFSLDMFVAEKLKHFSIPVKTKNLSKRLGVDPVELTQCLKRLEEKGIVSYITTKSKKDYNKLGWIYAFSNL